MKRIYKQPVMIAQGGPTPIPGEVKSAALWLRHEALYVWFEPHLRTTTMVQVFGTGHDMPDEAEFLATVQDDPFVWHLYDVTGVGR